MPITDGNKLKFLFCAFRSQEFLYYFKYIFKNKNMNSKDPFSVF